MRGTGEVMSLFSCKKRSLVGEEVCSNKEVTFRPMFKLARKKGRTEKIPFSGIKFVFSMSLKRRIKVAFANFWSGFNPDWFISEVPSLSDYEFLISDAPDFVFVSCFGGDLPAGNYTTILFLGENIRPDMSKYDWAFGSDPEESIRNPRYMRLPLFSLTCPPSFLIKSSEKVVRRNRKFCNFLYSKEITFRSEFCKALSRYKHIDCPGASQHNCPPEELFPREDPRWRVGIPEFMRAYKFTIAFENASFPGYTTEKLVHAMLAESLPIYWGNPRVSEDFNTRSFVCVHDYLNEATDAEQGLKKAVKQVIEIDQNPELFDEYLRQPWYQDNKIPAHLDPERFRSRFKEIFGD